MNRMFQDHNNKEDHLIYFIYGIHWVALTPKEYSNDAMHFDVTDFDKCKHSLINMSKQDGSDHIIKSSTVPPQSGPDRITEPLHKCNSRENNDDHATTVGNSMSEKEIEDHSSSANEGDLDIFP